jgi:Ca-activated chloride channel family protein
MSPSSGFHFEWPWAFAALLLLPLVAWRNRRLRTPAVVFNGAILPARSRRQRFLWIPTALRCLALALLIAAVARPQRGARLSRDITKSIAIQILIDRSGSMQHTDMVFRGRRATRLFTVTMLSRRFIFGDRSVINNSGLQGRPSDMVGLIEFAGDPITLSPLTLDHTRLSTLIERIEPARPDEDGTAIGDAVALAAARFHEAEAAAGAQLKSKIIVLLTDGENNMGARTPADAAALAKKWGVRIYAIGIRPRTSNSRYDEMMESGLDTLAEETGGIARMVADADALTDVYREIDRLEPTEVHPPKLSGGFPAFESLAVLALALLLLEVLLNQTWLRRIP